jgi:FkbM family methyltransferase
MLASLRRASIAAVRALPRVRGRGKLAAAMSGALLRAGASPLVTTTMNAGHRLILDTRVPAQLWAAYLGDYDRVNVEALRRFIQPGSLVLDVGANIGFYSVPLATAGARVLAFEPVPQNVQRLRQNVLLNGLEHVITIYPVALSSESGSADITLREDFAGGEVGNAAIAIADGKDGGFPTVTVPLARLDDLFPLIGAGSSIAVIKLDIEGHEDHFLRGARSTIGEHRPVILMEMNRWYYERRNLDLDVLLPTLLPVEYRPHRVDETGPVPIDTLSSIENVADVLLIPAERAPCRPI